MCDTIIPFLLNDFTNTSVLGLISALSNLLTLLSEGDAFSLFSKVISLIFLFNLFLKLFVCDVELFSKSVKFLIISFASSLASNKIFLALIFALFIISASCFFRFSLSKTKDFSNSDICCNFLSISVFSFSIILFWS